MGDAEIRGMPHGEQQKQEQSQLELLSLPEALLVRVLSCVRVHDIASVGCTCSALWKVSYSPALWRNLLDRDFAIPAQLAQSNENVMQLYKRIWNCNACVPVRGVLTDGGVDTSPESQTNSEDGHDNGWSLVRFAVDGLFEGDEVAPFHGYCSLEGSRAVHCLGVVCYDWPNRGLSSSVVAERERMVERCAGFARFAFHDSDASRTSRERAIRILRRWPTSHLESLFFELHQHSLHSSWYHDRMYAGVPERCLPREEALCHQIADRISHEGTQFKASDWPQDYSLYRPFKDCSSSSKNSNRNVVASADLFARSPGAVVKSLHVSRAGEYTCPVKCGAVFVARTASASKGDLHGLLRQMQQHQLSKALEGVACEQRACELSASGTLPPIRRRIQHNGPYNGGGVILEFDRQETQDAHEHMDLAMLFEFAPSYLLFTNRAMPSRAPDVSESRDHLTITLSQPRYGNAIMVALLAPEDLMQATGDPHSECNIDMSSIDVYGCALSNEDDVLAPS